MPEPKHLSPETLLAYHERTLPEADVERVQEHLVDCPECAAAVLDLESFPDLEPPTEAYRLSPADLRSQWTEIERRIVERRPLWQRHELLLPLAASLFVAAVGLGIWGQSARSQSGSGPRLSGDVVLIEPTRADVTHRGPAGAAQVPNDVETLAVVLDLSSAEVSPPYTLDIRSAGGELLARDLPVRRTQEGLVTVMVPRDLLAPGHNSLEIFGATGGERIPVATFGVETGR